MAQASDSSAAAGLVARVVRPDELDSDIRRTTEKIEKLETAIENLSERLNKELFEPDWRYPTRDDARTGLNLLHNEKVALQNEKVALQNEKVALQNKEVELLREKNIRLEQQQQSGAGTSMLCIKTLNSSP
jgi:predicted  nucleic acid-binding Zn-ribbon protein